MYKIIDGQQIEMTAEEVTANNSWSETDAQKLQKIKDMRLEKLIETDWWVLRGNITEAQTNYRQGLRDIPQNNTTEEEYDLLLARVDGQLTHEIWSKP